MNTPSIETHIYHFSFPALDTLLQVEEAGGEVTIRASRDTFSARRREHFIRELAAEGFIPDEHQWLNSGAPAGTGAVRWLVDHSCFQPDQAHTARTGRLMWRLLGSAALFWLMLMGLLLAKGAA